MGEIVIKKGDITLEDVDAIVNAANQSLRGGGGVDGAIHRAGGKAILEECIKIGGCPTGDAVITTGGNLKARYVIHAVGPVWRGGVHSEARLLRDCYTKSFQLARKNNLKSIAFPAISTGVYRYPVQEATVIALQEGIRHIHDFDEIRYVCFSDKDLDIYQRIYRAVNFPNE